MSARKTMFQTKKKAAAAAEVYEKAKAEASAPRKVPALAESSDEEGQEARHLSDQEVVDVPESSEEEGNGESALPPAVQTEAAESSASADHLPAPIVSSSSGSPSSVGQTNLLNPNMPPPAPKTPTVFASSSSYLPPLPSPSYFPLTVYSPYPFPLSHTCFFVKVSKVKRRKRVEREGERR